MPKLLTESLSSLKAKKEMTGLLILGRLSIKGPPETTCVTCRPTTTIQSSRIHQQSRIFGRTSCFTENVEATSRVTQFTQIIERDDRALPYTQERDDRALPYTQNIERILEAACRIDNTRPELKECETSPIISNFLAGLPASLRMSKLSAE